MTRWKCGECGYELQAQAPPEQCPVCKKKCEFINQTCYTPDCAQAGVDKRIK